MRRWIPLAKDGLHDPASPGTRQLQEPRDALARLAPDGAGNQVRWVQALDLDMEKVNVNGGAIAMGHPIGATGAMILGTMVDELERADKERALITLCIGAGMGTAMVIERAN